MASASSSAVSPPAAVCRTTSRTHRDRLPGALIARRRRADQDRGALGVGQVGVDAVGEAALDPDFLLEPRSRRSAAQDGVQDEGRKEIRVVPRHARQAEYELRLRNVHGDVHGLPGETPDLGRLVRELAHRQVAEREVEHAGKHFAINVARHPRRPAAGEPGGRRPLRADPPR